MGIKMFYKFNGLVAAVLFFGVLLASSIAPAASFVVADGDFVGGVYDFHYYNLSGSQTIINGVNQGIADPTLTNSGWICCGADSGVRYWQSNGQNDGALTMGWDFSAVTGNIASVEVLTRHYIFQFAPYGAGAAGDQIYGAVATPASYGASAYTDIYRYVSNNPNNDPNAPGAIGSGSLLDITFFIDGGWLLNPALLELQLGYDRTPSSTNPARHLQVFRDNSGTGDDGFVLRVTLAPVPVPATVWLLGSGLLGLIGLRRKRG